MRLLESIRRFSPILADVTRFASRRMAAATVGGAAIHEDVVYAIGLREWWHHPPPARTALRSASKRVGTSNRIARESAGICVNLRMS
jgi:hypothetical protein